MFINRIGFKFALPISGLIILTSFLLSLTFIRHETRLIEKEHQNMANASAQYLASNSEYGVLIHNYALLDKMISSMLHKNDIAWIEISGTGQTVLSSAGMKKSPYYETEAPILTESKSSPGSDTGREDLLFSDVDNTRDEERIGTVRLAISLEDMRAEIRSIRNRILLLTLAIILGSLFVIFYLIKTVTSPLHELLSAIKRISAGDLNVRANVRTGDETEELADAFNSMTDQLSRTLLEVKDSKALLEQWNRNLEKTLEDRTREIKEIQDRFLQSEKMSAVGQLAAGVAHEINNPLGVILGFAQGMCRRIEPGDKLELAVKSIEREATRCKNLVQDLLTFSRVTVREKAPLELNEVVGSSISLIESRAKVCQVEIRTRFTEGLPRVLGNKNQIQQIIINLANNALDAMEKGGVLTLSTELEQDRPVSWVCLKVTDTGPGIPPDILKKIFDPFFTTKQVGKGTGLGLSLVYEIAKKHSGSVEVQSRPGCTEFCVKFPGRTGREFEEHAAKEKMKSVFSRPPGTDVNGEAAS